MPLTVNNGTSLNPQPPGAPAEEHTVNIPHIPQEGMLWCWAACVQMVLAFNNIEMSQCEIVKKMLKDDTHKCGPNFQSRDESCAFMDMAPTWRDCGIKQVGPRARPLRMDEIKAEIAENRPIQCEITWFLGSGHAVLIKGWAETSPESLLIDDPLRDSPQKPVFDSSGLTTHDELLSAFSHGFWQLSWVTLIP